MTFDTWWPLNLKRFGSDDNLEFALEMCRSAYMAGVNQGFVDGLLIEWPGIPDAEWIVDQWEKYRKSLI